MLSSSARILFRYASSLACGDVGIILSELSKWTSPPTERARPWVGFDGSFGKGFLHDMTNEKKKKEKRFA